MSRGPYNDLLRGTGGHREGQTEIKKSTGSRKQRLFPRVKIGRGRGEKGAQGLNGSISASHPNNKGVRKKKLEKELGTPLK